MIDTMDLKLSNHIEWLNWGQKSKFYIKIQLFRINSKSTGEFPSEDKRDIDPFQDIHFFPFPVLLILTSLQWLGQQGPTG